MSQNPNTTIAVVGVDIGKMALISAGQSATTGLVRRNKVGPTRSFSIVLDAADAKLQRLGPQAVNVRVSLHVCGAPDTPKPKMLRPGFCPPRALDSCNVKKVNLALPISRNCSQF